MTIEERLEKVEAAVRLASRFNTWAFALAIVALVLGPLLTGWAFAVHRTMLRTGIVRARQVLIEDRDGKVCAILTGNEWGATLGFDDKNGTCRIVLGFELPDTAQLIFSDENGQSRAALSLIKHESSLMLTDENGKVTWNPDTPRAPKEPPIRW